MLDSNSNEKVKKCHSCNIDILNCNAARMFIYTHTHYIFISNALSQWFTILAIFKVCAFQLPEIPSQHAGIHTSYRLRNQTLISRLIPGHGLIADYQSNS